MTQVDFHVGAPDKLGYAARLVRKAFGAGARLVVTAADDVLVQFDAKLWTFGQLEFVPHVMAESALAARTPVVLASDIDSAPPGHSVLLNLDWSVPEGFARFERLLEVVGDDEAERARGRERYRHYRQRGYPIKLHEIVSP